MIQRKPHTLQPARWRVIAIVTDTPGPGEAHLTGEQVKEELDKMTKDLPAGVELEIGTIEKAASAPGGGQRVE